MMKNVKNIIIYILFFSYISNVIANSISDNITLNESTANKDDPLILKFPILIAARDDNFNDIDLTFLDLKIKYCNYM